MRNILFWSLSRLRGSSTTLLNGISTELAAVVTLTYLSCTAISVEIFKNAEFLKSKQTSWTGFDLVGGTVHALGPRLTISLIWFWVVLLIACLIKVTCCSKDFLSTCIIGLTPFAVPILLQALNRLAGLQEDAALVVPFFIFSITWLSLLYFVRQPLISPAYRLNKHIAAFTASCFIIQTAILFVDAKFSFGNTAVRCVFLSFNIVSAVGGICLKLQKYEYANENIQYASFVGYVAQLVAALIALLNFFIQRNEEQLIAVLPIAFPFLFHQSGVLKLLLKNKYERVLMNFENLPTSEDLLVFATLIYPQNRELGLDLQTPVEYARLRLHYNLKSRLHISADSDTLFAKAIAEYLTEQAVRDKSPAFLFYLVELLMRNGEYLKACKCLSLIQSRFNGIERELLIFDQQEYLCKMTQLGIGFLNSSNSMLCRASPPQKLDVQSVFEEEAVTSKFILHVDSLLKLKADFSNLLLNNREDYIQDSSISAELHNLEKLHIIIKQFLDSNNQLKTKKRFVAAYYVYLRHGCRLRSEIPVLLDQYFRRDPNYCPRNKELLMRLVSGQNGSMGVILNANTLFREFFGILPKKIEARAQMIDCMIPEIMRTKHDELMKRFKLEGDHDIHETNQKLYVVSKDRMHLVNAAVIVVPSIDGITFSGCMSIEESFDYIILDEHRIPSQYSSLLASIIKRKGTRLSGDQLFLHDAELGVHRLRTDPHVMVSFEAIEIEEVKFTVCKIQNGANRPSNRKTRESSTNISAARQLSTPTRINYRAAAFQRSVLNLRPAAFTPYRLYILTLLFALSILANVGYLMSCHRTQLNLSSQIGVFYVGYKEGFIIKSNYLSARTSMMNAIQSGKISDQILVDRGLPSLTEYLLAPNPIFTGEQSQLHYIFDFKPNLWKFYPPLLSRRFRWNSQNVSFLQVLTSFKSYAQEVLAYTPEEVHQHSSLLFKTNGFATSAASAVRDVVNNPFKSLTLDDSNRSLVSFYYVAGGLLLLMLTLVAALTIQLKIQFDKKQQGILLFTSLPSSIYGHSLLQYKRGRCFLKSLMCCNVLQLTLSSNELDVECQLSDKTVLRQEDLGVESADLRLVQQQKTKVTSFFVAEIVTLILFVVGLLLIGVLAFQLIVAAVRINNYLAEYYTYIDNTSSLRTSNANLVETAMSSILNGAPTPAQVSNLLKYVIALKNRTVDEVIFSLIKVLKSKLPWTQVNNFLYQPLCSLNDLKCSNLLGGALLVNFPSTLVAVCNQYTVLIRNNSKQTPEQIQSLLKQTVEVYVTSVDYITPRLQAIYRRSLEALLNDLNNVNISLLTFVTQVFAPLMLVLTLLLVTRLWNKCQQMYNVFKQAATQELYELQGLRFKYHSFQIPSLYSGLKRLWTGRSMTRMRY